MSTEISNFSRLQELLPELFQTNQLQGDSYLRSQLTPEINVLMSMESVQESLLVNEEQITPIPNMPAYFVGLMNSRDRVFGLIDLPQFFGLTDKVRNSRRIYHTIVTRVTESSNSEPELLLGFVLHQVQGVTRINSEQMESAPANLPSSLMPYLSRCLIDRQRQVPVLDLANIIRQVIEK